MGKAKRGTIPAVGDRNRMMRLVMAAQQREQLQQGRTRPGPTAAQPFQRQAGQGGLGR
jgi:hypothetical protein